MGRCHVRDQLAGFNAPAEQEPTSWGEGGVTVSHEDLRVVVLAWTPAHLLPVVFALVESGRVNNFSESYTSAKMELWNPFVSAVSAPPESLPRR